MKLFVEVWFWLYTLGIVCGLLLLALHDYPRSSSKTRVDDVIALFGYIIFAIWAAHALGWII